MALTKMSSEKRRSVSPEGNPEKPNEVDKMLSKYSLSLGCSGLRNLAASEAGETENILKEIDHLLTKDLLDLSVQDRNAIAEEIHGVQTICPEESPNMIQQSLHSLQMCIEELPPTSKIAYLRSQELQLPDSYIHSNDFRLRFLRCDLFDSEKAAVRMLSFLDLLLELFGDYALKRPITILDLSWEEMQVFRRGNLQLLPYRDRSGRRIFASVGGFAMDTSLTIKVKVMFYLLLSASEDVESQRKGITSIIFPGTRFAAQKESSKVNLEHLVFMNRVYASLPIRTSAMHFCLPNSPFVNVFRMVFLMSMSTLRKRMKFHTGKDVEVLYSLKGYGIPVELIPLTDTGNIKTIYLKQWIKLRKYIDSLGEKFKGPNHSVIECPGSKDVVFRPGTSVSYHPGNVRFRSLLETVTSPQFQFGRMERVERLKNEMNNNNCIRSFKATQAEMAEYMTRQIHNNGGRFLRWDNKGYWTEIYDIVQINNKVSLSIRDFKYKTKAQRKNRQETKSYTYLFCQQQNDGGKRKRAEGKDPPNINCKFCCRISNGELDDANGGSSATIISAKMERVD